MPHNEFDIIKRYFSRHVEADGRFSPSYKNKTDFGTQPLLGVGDDCAMLAGLNDQAYCVTVDSMVEGRHFFNDAKASDLGHKSLATSLSDLAAMAATPHSALLSLTLPAVDTAWLQGFSDGFYALADHFSLRLIGGNTTRGPLNISVTAFGVVDAEKVLKRSGAAEGDAIYVVGALGDAACALAYRQGKVSLNALQCENIMPAWHRPWPLCDVAQALAPYVSAAIDVSDGLLADLRHLLTASGGLGATLYAAQIPLSNTLESACDADKALEFALSGGEDYALCMTVAEENEQAFQLAMAHQLPENALAIDSLSMGSRSSAQLGCSRIGTVTASLHLEVLDQQGVALSFENKGWSHF